MADVAIENGQIVLHSSEPTCCPDVYLCFSGPRPELECPRHGGFSVCCDRPGEHVGQKRPTWHQQMARWEQGLLDQHIRQHLAAT
jgi:hypothetical protein